MRLFIALVIVLLSVDALSAQRVETRTKIADIRRGSGYSRDLASGFKQVEIPFEFENNFIIVNVLFSNQIPLKFIFDTGAEHTILTRKEISDLLGIPYHRRFTVYGADLKTELHAYLIRQIDLKVGEVNATNQSMLVLEDDYFKFEEFTGQKIYGIIGAEFFKGFIIKIDYQRKRITMTSVRHFKEPKAYTKIPLELKRQKPYIQTQIKLQEDTIVPVKLLLDTGASLSLLINSNTHPNLAPPANSVNGNVGLGLGGFLDGHLGRINQLNMANFAINDVVTNFQELPEESDTTHLNGRNGLIGNGILSRFTVIIDYPRGFLYLKPNKKFSKPFKYDKSGLQLISSGTNLKTVLVQSIIGESPAAEIGLQKGDMIQSVNGWPTSVIGLSTVINILKKKEGKKITLKIKRDQVKIKKVFYLRKLI